jgi:hypothetical protein
MQFTKDVREKQNVAMQIDKGFFDHRKAKVTMEKYADKRKFWGAGSHSRENLLSASSFSSICLYVCSAVRLSSLGGFLQNMIFFIFVISSKFEQNRTKM